ncbi:MAG: hypothetical protein WBB19_18550 [Desulforhopalus sp.]
MELTIKQSCPSCGAAIVLKEDDRLVECAFCGVHNYRIGSVGSRYVLPYTLPDQLDETQLLFTPYLRFKGSIFFVRDNAVRHKVVDTTRLGLDNRQLPVSLGLRPQAMKIKPVVSSTRGVFIQQSVPTKTVFGHAAMIIDLLNDQNEHTTYHRAFIGETLSRIYQPWYLKDDRLYDAVTGRAVGHRSVFEKHLTKTCSGKVTWEPQFVTTICPGCGGLLSGARESMVLQCRNCSLLWQEQNGKFVHIDWKIVESDDPAACYLPFWQIRCDVNGSTLKNFGDYLRFTNQPLVVTKKHDLRLLVFWIPAFKLHPKAFLQVASQLTLAQERIPEGGKQRVANGHPVTLDRKEAAQAVKSVLAHTILSKEKKFPLLPALRLSASHCALTYLPFERQTHDVIQHHTHATIQTAAIRHGRDL